MITSVANQAIATVSVTIISSLAKHVALMVKDAMTAVAGNIVEDMVVDSMPQEKVSTDVVQDNNSRILLEYRQEMHAAHV